MAKPRKDDLEETKRLMGALLRMPPKQHEDMKVKKREPSKLSPRPSSRKKQQKRD